MQQSARKNEISTNLGSYVEKATFSADGINKVPKNPQNENDSVCRK